MKPNPTNGPAPRASPARKRDLKPREELPRPLLRPNPPRVGDKVNMHPVSLGVSVQIDLYLGEETECFGGEADGHDAGHAGWGLQICRRGREAEARKLAQAGEDELGERAEELVHLRTAKVDLGAEWEPRAHPAADGLDAAHDLHARAAAATAALFCLAGERAQGHDGPEEVLSADEGVLRHGVQLYALKTDNVLRGCRGCGLAAKLGAADRWVLSQLDVWVLRVVHEADAAGWWTRTTLVLVGHV